jgi:hypothetical protein
MAQFVRDGGANDCLDGRLLVKGDLLELSLHRLRYAYSEEDDFLLDGVLLGGWHRDALPGSWNAQR